MGQVKRCLAALRGMNGRHALAALFLGLILLVSCAALPTAIDTIGSELKASGISPRKIAVSFDTAYRQMLNFSGPFPINKGSYIDLNGLMARLMGQRIINNCVRLNNGHLGGYGGETEIPDEWPQLVKLCKAQMDAGKAFLFVLAPGQVSKHEQLMPAGVESSYNHAADAMLSVLQRNGVPTLDLRDAMHQDGLRSADAFFVTDLHWKPETAFWAFGRILADLSSKGVIPAVDAQYTDPVNYQTQVYPRWFLGSSGRRTGQYYAGVDDFSIITPKFDTQLTTEIPTKNIRNQGSFAQTTLDWRYLNPKDYYRQDPYELYGYGNPDEMRYSNPSAPQHQKVLWLGDSFGSAVVPFVSLVFDTVEDLDMRYYKKDFATFYRAYQPDIVVLLVNATGTLQENTTYAYLPDR